MTPEVPGLCTSAPVGQKASQCPQEMHIGDFPSGMRGSVSSSAGSITDMGQTSEQIPHRVHKSESIYMVMEVLPKSISRLVYYIHQKSFCNIISKK
jgi:hypothetical protein